MGLLILSIIDFTLAMNQKKVDLISDKSKVQIEELKLKPEKIQKELVSSFEKNNKNRVIENLKIKK